MAEPALIAVDAMGGDNAPRPEVAGAVRAVAELDLRVALVGDAGAIRAELAALGAAEGDRLEVVHAADVVTMDDHPGRVFKQKPDSSMRRAFDLVADGRADAVVSAGNSGAVLGHGLFVLGRIDGVERPGIVTVLPTASGGTLVLCDTGANVEVKPTMLAQFGWLGAHYDRIAHGHTRPRVGLLSNGAEASKGTSLTRAAHELLERMAAEPGVTFDYVGYVEGTDLFAGGIDVVATDGFTGNIVLKLSEGLAEAMFALAGSLLPGDAGGELQRLRKRLDYRERGGALLGGVKGVVMIAHGRSDARAIRNAIRSADGEVRGGLLQNLAAAASRFAPLWASIRSEGESP